MHLMHFNEHGVKADNSTLHTQWRQPFAIEISVCMISVFSANTSDV